MRHKLMACLFIAVLLLSGCQARQDGQTAADTADPNEIVTLKAITMGAAPKSGLDSLYEELDALTIPELGCVLRFTYIPWGDERNQINLAIASGEYDFFPQGNFTDYQLMASRNAFLDIKPYLSLVPDLVAHYQLSGEDVLANAEMDGKLYGIPQYGAPGVSANEGFLYREDLRVEWGLDPIVDLATMEAYLYRAKEDEAFADKALITDNRIWTSLWSILTKDLYFEITGFTDTPYVVCSIDAPYQALSRMETPEFRIMLEYLRKWYQDGILDRRLLTLSANEGTSSLALFLAGDKPCETNSPIWSVNREWIPVLTEAHPGWTYGFWPYDAGGRKLNYKEGSAHGSMIAISRGTQHPEQAVRLLEKLHTDQRYYDLLVYGVEGVHYHLDGDVVRSDDIPAEEKYVYWTASVDAYMDHTTVYCDNDAWTEGVYLPYLAMCDELSEKAEYHPLNNYIFNAGDVTLEATKLAESWNAYMMPILCGLSENIDAELEAAADQLKAAGLDQYLMEVQRQLTEFQQEKSKEK